MQSITREESVRAWAEANRSRMIDFISGLVRFDTVNRFVDGDERDCQHFFADKLKSMGLEVELYSPEDAPGFREHPAYYPGKDYSDRPNVASRWKGTGGGKSLLFSGHMDTAVVAPGWSHSPWEPREEGDRLYGLGSFDMKGGLGAAVMAVLCLQELNLRPQGDVLIESVVDEEFGGANGTLAGRLKGIEADAAIIPEPTNLDICPATRGGAIWRLTFRGKTGLSFSGETLINPLYDAGKFMAYLEQFEQERSSKPGPAPWYEQRPELPVIITRVEAGDMTAALCDVGPEECHVDIWIECHPGTTEEQLKQEMIDGYLRQYGPDARLPEFRKMIRFLPGAQLSPDFPLLPLLAEAAGDVTGEEAVIQGAPFACDSFMFNLYSPTPAVVLGPKGANAHAADEYIDIPSLLQLVEIYALTILRWCGAEEGKKEE
ncbi:M20 family metallopeptidase [Paenibacillus sp. J2TS4]|uniref:M20 family metallopeptidase n=1 Tax=Paenibacillus sp. J2TS4 TaxID=2807194 RepID=UPI001B2EC06C|nr:M20/M25/M40 family metallo-hydrolase [Paenibacillus sp. J2TS4]GIP35286.1 acetylornithine deacetylase [Paenibacillus sp. J2TS4]